MERKSKTVVLGIIENENGQILMTERIDPKIKAAHKKRDIPGGTNEIGETLEQTLVREIKEETGLLVRDFVRINQSYTKTWEHEEYIQETLLHCFVCKFDGGTINTKDSKIGKIERKKIQEALQLELLETTMFFLDNYNKYK